MYGGGLSDVNYRRPPRMIFNGVDTGSFRPARDAAEKAKWRHHLDFAQHRPVALFVGRFVEKKGLDVLRQAAALGSDIDWVFAGWGGLDPNAWGLANVFVRAGLTQASLAPLYRASDVLVLPSTGEGLPLVLQEAMACGLASVLNAETAAADDRLDGLSIPGARPRRHAQQCCSGFAGGPRRACTQPPRESQRRFECMRAWYSWPAAARQYQGIFERVIADRRLPRPASACPGPAAGARP